MNKGNYKHGGYTVNKPEYNSWRAMKERCDNPSYRAYHRYGGRGIIYTQEWGDFGNFFKDMGKKPTPKHELDRIDNNGNYCPENCRWVDGFTQRSNTSRNRWVEIDGISKTVSQWARHYGIKVGTIYNRMRDGHPVEYAITTPLSTPGKHITKN